MKPPVFSRLICVLLALGFAACAVPRQAALPTGSAVREEFDPQNLNDEDFLLQPPASQSQVVARPESRPEATPAAQTEGYRVQIAAVLDRTRAEAFRAEVERQLEAPVYIAYDEDTRLYKIQVGNAHTPAEATALRAEAKRTGYREAYVVRTLIEVSAPPVRRPSTVTGYRLQIFSASSHQAAEQALARARELFAGTEVYVEFEPPFFKVRVGDFRTRKEAESFVAVAKKLGYDKAFPAETQIKASSE
ncbi:MAG: SPOR domain-containing protein [Candidatus Latescibacteria bacterium]|jgi:hypothetical protein|nr:SPOR domain-containing protein [Candidatus Latescibacterota bacterium]